jgi:amino acid transporter
MTRQSTSDEPSKSNPPGGTLGTFAGVFTPSILTILGIILFMRLGYVVGSAGLGRAMIILALANGISVLTTFSLSAVATNLRVKGGGDYYLISRTLGLEFGGSIGIVLYLAQSVSIAFYCIGFAEVTADILQLEWKFFPQLIAAAAVAFLFVFAWLGADWATRFQFGVMAILILALISFFVGGMWHWDAGLLVRNWGPPESAPDFWIVFAIFFPAVTGFTQGVSMSGDLKDPGKSLPLGTFWAVGISIVVYFLAALVFAGALPQSELISDYAAMQRVAAVAFIIVAGVVAATLSSAMASFLGAPRILQSLAGDRIFPFLLPFAKGSGLSGNPRRGVLLSTVIAYATIALGNLNLIAPVVSMFFLISYGLLNYATYYEARSASPSFRPRFRWYDARASLVGALACLGAMLAIDPLAGILAIAVLFAVYQYLQRTSGPARWADSRRSYHLQRTRRHLLAAASEEEHPRYWRPQILLFSSDPHRRRNLMRVAGWIQGESGFTTVVKIVKYEGLQTLKTKEETLAELKRDIQTAGLDAFPLVVASPDVESALGTIVQAAGIGPVRANTLLLNWIERSKSWLAYIQQMYGRSLRMAFRYGCNLMVLNASPEGWDRLEAVSGRDKCIDVWWSGDATSRLMLLLAYLVRRNPDWEDARIRVLSGKEPAGSKTTVEGLETLLQEVRIEAEPVIVDSTHGALDEMIAASAEATIAFVPFRLREDRLVDPAGGSMERLLPRLPITLMVLAAEDIDLDAAPEEGPAADMAAARDALADAEKRIRSAEKEVADAAHAVGQIKAERQRLQVEGKSASDLEKLTQELSDAEGILEQAKRKLAKVQAKAETARKEADSLGIEAAENDEPDQ